GLSAPGPTLPRHGLRGCSTSTRPCGVRGPACSLRANVDDGHEELPRSDVVGTHELIREALVPLQRLRVFAAHDLHASTFVRKERGAFGVSASAARTRV